jgi:predicted nucleic acid-binding protein
MYLLDTSALIEFFIGSQKGAAIRDYLKGDEYFIAAPTVYEINKGKSKKETLMYFIKNSSVLDFTSESGETSASIYKKLEKKGKMVNELDIMIAGIGLCKGLEIISCDKDFEKIRENMENAKIRVF